MQGQFVPTEFFRSVPTCLWILYLQSDSLPFPLLPSRGNSNPSFSSLVNAVKTNIFNETESLQPYGQWAPGGRTLQLLLWRMTKSRHSRYWISRSSGNNLLQMLLHRLFSVVAHTTDAGCLKEARLLATMLRSSLFFLFHWLLDIINKLHTWSSFYFLFFSYIYLNRWETLLSSLNLVQYTLFGCISGNVVSGHKCLNFSSSSRGHYAKPCKVRWKMGGTKVGGKNKAMIKFFLRSCF